MPTDPTPNPETAPATAVLTGDGLAALLQALVAAGYRTIGPTVQAGAIVYDDVAGLADLPAGWSDEQDAGHYRLQHSADPARFGYTAAAQSWKRFLHLPRLRVAQFVRGASNDGDAGSGASAGRPTPVPAPTAAAATDTLAAPLAFIGVRPCELRAIALQDRVLLGGEHPDPHYRSRRAGLFIVAVNCTRAGGTCFCASMDAGPRVPDPITTPTMTGAGFDLALTELNGTDGPRYLVETGSNDGAALLATLPRRPATAADLAAAAAGIAQAAATMGRALRTDDVHDLLCGQSEHPHWDAVAARCLACANCTLVCPTCFCTTIEDRTDLTGAQAERWRRWDACFTGDFSYLHGGAVRASTRARYRQWLTHKLATWFDQFGSSGCVGCGRCITWCPVGIDLTAEVATLRAAVADAAPGATSSQAPPPGTTTNAGPTPAITTQVSTGDSSDA